MSFAGPLAAAVRDGRKTQTRRPVKPQPARVEAGVPRDARGEVMACPLATVRGGLWVREPVVRTPDGFAYAADGATGCNSSGFMPKIACRTWLRVTAVTCQRLTAITPADALAEGCPDGGGGRDPVGWFRRTWGRFYDGPLGWEADPWVWVVHFERWGVGDQAQPGGWR